MHKHTELVGSTQTRICAAEVESLPGLRSSAADGPEGKRRLRMSFSSETPVLRPWGLEILDHNAQSVDLSAMNGAPLLLEHNRNDQIGVVENAEIASRRGRAVVRFSKSTRAEEIHGDVMDGIRQRVSVGYKILEARNDGQAQDGTPITRVTKWQPVEISITALAADNTVGPNRSQPKITMQTTAATEDTNLTKDNSDNPSALRRERGEILAIGKQFGVERLAARALAEGMTLDDFRALVLETKFDAKPLQTAEPNIGMGEPEKRSYSLLKGIRELAQTGRVSGLEKEASDAVSKKLRLESRGGFLVPWDIATHRASPPSHEQRSLATSPGSAGGYLTETSVLPLIELLRNRMVTGVLGATELSGLSGNLVLPRSTGAAQAFWLAEGASVPSSDQSFGALLLSIHRLAAVTAFSTELVASTSQSVEQLVRDDLMRVLAIEKDRAALNGSGAGGEPLGILSVTGTGATTFGGAPTWSKILEFEEALGNSNADVVGGRYGWATTPTVKRVWKSTTKVTNQASFLWENATGLADATMGLVNGAPALSSNQIPSNRALFANWADLILATWSAFDLIVDPYSRKKEGLIEVQITSFCDSGPRHAPSFVISTDSGAQA